MVGSKAAIYLFMGDDNYQRDGAIEEMRSSLFKDSSSELDYRIFYGGEADMRDLLDYIATIPFSAAHRLAVIKDFEKTSSEFRSRLALYIRKPSKSTSLILEMEGDNLPEEFDGLRGRIIIRRFGHLTDSELTAWIRRFTAPRGKSIESDAVRYLKELNGNNLLTLTQELEKLIAFIGEREIVKTADVEEVVGKSLSASAFDLTAAIGARRVRDAINIISDLIAAGKRHYEIIGLLCWHLKKMMRARMREAHSNSPDIAKIRQGMMVLLNADLNIKRARYDPRLILEFTVIRLCLL